jgi:hypothetical protein
VLFVDTFLYQRPNTTQYPTCTREDISTYRCTNPHGCLEPCQYLPSSHPSTYYASLRSFRFAHHPQPVAAAACTVPNRTFCHETNLHQWFTDVGVPTAAASQQLFPWYARTVSVSAQPAERMSDVKPHAAPLPTDGTHLPKSTQCAASQATANRHSQEPHFFAHGQHAQGI